jgi:hypothetical protein
LRSKCEISRQRLLVVSEYPREVLEQSAAVNATAATAAHVELQELKSTLDQTRLEFSRIENELKRLSSEQLQALQLQLDQNEATSAQFISSQGKKIVALEQELFERSTIYADALSDAKNRYHSYDQQVLLVKEEVLESEKKFQLCQGKLLCTIDELEKYIFTPEQLQREEELIRSREAMKLELGENGDNQDDRSSSSSNDTTDYNTVSESAQQEGNIFNSGDSKEREQISFNNNIESSDNSPEVNHIATENDIVNANSEKNNNDAENIREAQTTVM